MLIHHTQNKRLQHILNKKSYKYTHKNLIKNNNTTNTKDNKIINTKENNNITHLSYNISWESMSGSVKDWDLCSNNTDKNNPKHNSICISNIGTVINENKTDFVTLQEAGDYKKLLAICPHLSTMHYKTYKSGLNVIVTFWNNKYKFIKKITGEFSKGRPWMAIIFSGELCVINVHFGHYKHYEEYNKLKSIIHDIKHELADTNIFIKRYIIAGDFNYDIKKLSNNSGKINLDNIIFYYHPKHLLTCCVRRITHYDHIIDSYKTPNKIFIPNVKYMASDHKPIIAVLSL